MQKEVGDGLLWEEPPGSLARLTFTSHLDGAHTLTCALMLLNTDLHGHVSEGMASGSRRTRHIKALGGSQPHRPLFSSLRTLGSA